MDGEDRFFLAIKSSRIKIKLILIKELIFEKKTVLTSSLKNVFELGWMNKKYFNLCLNIETRYE